MIRNRCKSCRRYNVPVTCGHGFRSDHNPGEARDCKLCAHHLCVPCGDTFTGDIGSLDVQRATPRDQPPTVHQAGEAMSWGGVRPRPPGPRRMDTNGRGRGRRRSPSPPPPNRIVPNTCVMCEKRPTHPLDGQSWQDWVNIFCDQGLCDVCCMNTYGGAYDHRSTRAIHFPDIHRNECERAHQRRRAENHANPPTQPPPTYEEDLERRELSLEE